MHRKRTKQGQKGVHLGVLLTTQKRANPLFEGVSSLHPPYHHYTPCYNSTTTCTYLCTYNSTTTCTYIYMYHVPTYLYSLWYVHDTMHSTCSIHTQEHAQKRVCSWCAVVPLTTHHLGTQDDALLVAVVHYYM